MKDYRHILENAPDRKNVSARTGRRKAFAWAKQLGVPLNPRRCGRASYGYDGKDIAARRLEPMELLHEMAHWLVASPERRKLPDFGLGLGPFSGLRADPVVPQLLSEEEEWRASVLGVLLERKAGLPYKETLRAHGWTESEDPDDNLTTTILELIDAGHITPDLEPVFDGKQEA